MIEEGVEEMIDVDAMEVDQEAAPPTMMSGKGKGANKSKLKGTSSTKRKGKRKADTMDETPEEKRGKHLEELIRAEVLTQHGRPA